MDNKAPIVFLLHKEGGILMADKHIPVPRNVIIPEDLCAEIHTNEFRPVRCIRLLYEYNNTHFARVAGKLGIDKTRYKQVVAYLRGEGTNEWRRKIATTNAFMDFGRLIIQMADNEDYFRWLFTTNPKSRRMLLAQGVFSWEDYKWWSENMADTEIVPLFKDVSNTLRDTQLKYKTHRLRTVGMEVV